MADGLVTPKLDDVDGGNVEFVISGGNAHELALVGSGDPHPRDHFAAVLEHLFDRHVEVGEGAAEQGGVRPRCLLSLRYPRWELLVLNEVVREELIDHVEIALVEDLLVDSLHCGLEIGHGEPPQFGGSWLAPLRSGDPTQMGLLSAA